MALRKKTESIKQTTDNGILNIDDTFKFADAPAPGAKNIKHSKVDKKVKAATKSHKLKVTEPKTTPDKFGVINLDETFTFIGSELPAATKNKSKGLSKFNLANYFSLRNIARGLCVMLLAVVFMGVYTFNKVDDNITQMRADATYAAEAFAEDGVGAFVDSDKIVEKSGKKLMKTVKKTAIAQSDTIAREKRVADFLNALDSLADRIIANHFWYSNANNSDTYQGALRKKKVTNCARYVSWACQEAGLISPTATFWLNTRINGNAGAITSSPYLSVSYPRKVATACDLQPGDIVGWGTKGGQHTAVYAGRDEAGNMLWYSAGGDGAHSSGGKKYFDSKMKARIRRGYERHRIDVLIRIK